MNLLLISIDSLRLDYVSRTDTQVSTPRFDALTTDFCFYDRLFSVSSATRPVHTSLLTGLYPFEHGVLGQRSPSMRAGICNLFDLFIHSGWSAHGYSEAKTIFTNLPYDKYIAPLSPDAQTGLSQLSSILHRTTPRSTFLFLHYWSVHTPYGAPDGKANGEIKRLLETGNLSAAQARYRTAVERLFEEKLVPLLAAVDLGNWAIVILSDHGESWTAEEPYHGQTLRNSVLRVPLYFHFPYTGNPPPPRSLLSIVDLFPTIVALSGLTMPHECMGCDMRDAPSMEYYLAQIDPIDSNDDLPISSPAIPDRPDDGKAGLQWALFDENYKFTYDVKSARGRLERTFSEEALVDARVAQRYLQEFEEMQKKSSHVAQSIIGTTQTEEDLLDRRLRDLGYLD